MNALGRTISLTLLVLYFLSIGGTASPKDGDRIIFSFTPEVALAPDRLMQSKKVKGRLIEMIWGDYRYAFFATKTGKVTFLINGNEDCFLSKYKNEELSIDYDVIDRYIPQAAGYVQVNVIRNIQSKTTNLAIWRRSFTQEEFNKCTEQNR
jgi:hypothetical protein